MSAQTHTVVIDGKECTCKHGEYLWDMAARNGIAIPALCRSSAFDEHRASCRICIVEVEAHGRRKVVTSCVYPIEQDCNVSTRSERILEERAVISALLAARAPESAQMAQMAHDMGGDAGFERLLHVKGESCILCGLCVQACESLGTGAISTVLRGTQKQVNTPYGEPSASCIGCLSCANVCPTGAIAFSETEEVRTIWERDFDLVHCSACGEAMGTTAMREYAAASALAGAAQEEQEAPLCDACRKKRLANSLADSYRMA